MADQGDLFAAPVAHDPGGKVRLALPGGVIGQARISACERYRHFLSRDWTPEGRAPRAILWLGMNPSTADAFVSDPTVRREETYSRDWGYSLYYKGNILDWRATNPKDLPVDPGLARSVDNLPSILEMAEASELVIAAFGRLHKRYHPIIEETVAALRATGKPLMCLGQNQDGSPKHPLYLRKDLQPLPF